jgi:hypothetical protein
MLAEQRAQMPDDAGPVFIRQQQHDPADGNLHRRAVKPHDARIVRRAKEGTAGGNDLLAAVERLHMQPFIERDRFARTLFLDRQAERRRDAADVYVVQIFY